MLAIAPKTTGTARVSAEAAGAAGGVTQQRWKSPQSGPEAFKTH